MREFEYKKVIITGHVIEVYEMEKKPINPHELGDKDDGYKALEIKTTEEIKEEFKRDFEAKQKVRGDRKEERRAQTLRDARNKVRRLALANFKENHCFVTLTYAENMQDIEQADKDFKAFIRRLKKFTGLQGDLKYLAVREFQKRGAIHYHLLVNWELPALNVNNENYIRYLECEVADRWGNGFVDIKPLNKAQTKNKKYNGKPVDNVGAYISKYMSKEYDDKRLKGKKAYLSSKGLDQPIVVSGEEALELIKLYNLDEKKETFTNSYESEYLGKINYKEYNMKRLESEQNK